ncbi:MAG: primosomal protein N' [Bacilli bacterium]|nr:primosomal protein N' [Bacilli bacterium]
MVAEVLIQIKNKNLDRTFTYSVPLKFQNKMKLGIRVTVPFQNRQLEGFVLKIDKLIKTEYEIKEIIKIVDDKTVLNKEMIALGKYMQTKTLSPLISCYQTMLPLALKAKEGTVVNKKYESILVLKQEQNMINNKQKQIVALIKTQGFISKKDANFISSSAVKTLIKHSIIEEQKLEHYRLKSHAGQKYIKNKLTSMQLEVANEIEKNLNKFVPYLLHGVTGSGKTEVYMKIIEEVAKQNKEAIVLVPEISLTPQIVDKFRSRFGDDIAILHSRLSNGERYDEWRKIENREVKIVIGARSAAFAPFTNLGVIIIDEEHSATYKQENNPRYNTIDMALFRAKYHKCPLILGSATPSIESYTRSKMGIYKLLELKSRVNANLPNTYLIDMKEEIKKGNKILSLLLQTEIKAKLNNNEQIILFLNRRGYSTIVSCHQCGYTDKCPHCDIPLTYHKTNNMMRCHYCGYAHSKLLNCPACHSSDISEYGLGTEKLEETVKGMFPIAKIVRMDVDTTSNKGSHEKIIQDFQNHKYDILIGTQMIAKGLDFADVTLVGVINADATLNIPDFRSGERTHQLLNQVSGRAGRGSKKGEVVIQGFNLDHYSIITASKHDYEAFYNEEIKIRKKLAYPPFYNLSLIKITGKDYNLLWQESRKIKSYLERKLDKKAYLLGPNHPSVPKINDVYILQIILKYQKTNEVLEIVSELLLNSTIKVKVEFDLNPIKI